MDEKSIRNNIRMLRMQKGLSHDEMAELLHINRVTYTRLENGRVQLYNRNLEPLAAFFGMSLEELMLGYAPDREASLRLEETKAGYDEKYNRLQKEFDAGMDARDTEIATLRELVSSLKDTIQSQSQIIKMLRKQIPPENA